MIWLHGLLLLLLLAFVQLIDLRTWHMPNEQILTGLCLSASWIWVQPGSGRVVWSAGNPLAVVMTLLEQWA